MRSGGRRDESLRRIHGDGIRERAGALSGPARKEQRPEVPEVPARCGQDAEDWGLSFFRTRCSGHVRVVHLSMCP